MAKSKSEKKSRKAESKSARASSSGATPIGGLLLGVAVLVLLGAIGGTVFYYRTVIADGFTTGHDAVLSHLGFGIVPIAAWLAVAVGLVKYRRHSLGHPRVWAASLLLLGAAFGILSFFSFQNGAMAYFTLDGTYGLGGKLGQWVSGIYGGTGSIFNQALGALRVAALVFAGAALIAPVLAFAAWEITTTASMYLYVRFVMAMRGAFEALGRRLRQRRAARAAAAGAQDTQITEAPAQTGDWQDIPATPMFDTGVPVTTPSFGSSSGSSEKPNGSFVYTGTPAPRTGFAESSDFDDTFEDTPQRKAVFGGVVNASTMEDGIQVEAYEELTTGDARRVNGSPNGSGDDFGSFGNAPLRPDAADTPSESEDEASTSGRFNRFWSMADPDSDADAVEEGSDASDGAQGGLNGASDAGVKEIQAEPPPRRLPGWTKPPIQLLDDTPPTFISNEEISATANAIKATLADYGVEVEIGQAKPGPAVTMYGLTPGWIRKYRQVRERNPDGTPKLDERGKQVMSREETKTRVKVDSILHREKDLALALKTPSIRIETPVMGQSLLGIEVPNPNPSVVSLRSVMESKEFRKLRSDSRLATALGRGSGGETMVTDLTKMPHLLIAGATGSGKSVCINGIVSCLIMEKAPDELRLLLVDPKRVELTPYNGVPHLLTPVVVETDQVVGLLKGVIREMMDRYRKMEELGVRNIEAYNKKVEDRMPFLVVVVDELADLIMTASFDVEQSLCRLAQLGRATGIHLVIATQRPSVDVLTGLIKANFPSRISFGVTSQIDSRTILDTSGAEKLLGRGDMLFQPIDANRPERVQGVWISDSEVEELVTYWQSTQRGPLPEVNLEAVPEDDTSDDFERSEDRDDMMDKAIELAQTQSKLSTSLLQRRLRIGYPRAARLMDQMEEEGIVGPSDGSKSRDVIISSS